MARIDEYPNDPAPTGDDLVLTVDVGTNSTKTAKIKDVFGAGDESIANLIEDPSSEVSTALTSQFAPLASPTFTGDVDATAADSVVVPDAAGATTEALNVQTGDGRYTPRMALVLPGTTTNYVSTPDHSSLDITSDIDLIWCGSFTEWNPGAIRTLIAKADASGTQRSFYLSATTFGRLDLQVSSNGSSTTAATASATPSFTANTYYWLRATWRASDGRVQFFHAAFTGAMTVPSSWTQIGTNLTANVGSLFSSSSPLEVGSRSAGATTPHSGRVLRAVVKDGIDGTVVADYRGDTAATKYIDSTGKLWTVNGTAAGFALGN